MDVTQFLLAYRRGKVTERGQSVRLAAVAFVKKFVLTFGGASFIKNLISTARRRGVPFTRVKGTKTRLGRCPKTPVAGCAGYGLIFNGS